MRQKLQRLPEPSPGPGLTKRDWTGALGLCLLSFLSTFPVVVPFLFLSDAKLALRVSGEFNRSSQHPEIGGCDDGLQTCLGSMHKKEVACARAPACLAA
jgi:hypothetical protein